MSTAIYFSSASHMVPMSQITWRKVEYVQSKHWIYSIIYQPIGSLVELNTGLNKNTTKYK